MPTLGIFIVAHDQNLIIEFHHKINRSFLNNCEFQYILVGQNPDTSILDRYSDICSRVFLPCRGVNNIERYPRLLTFTAWHYLANLKTGIKYTIGDLYDYVGIFEYDIEINKDLSGLIALCSPNTLLSFSPNRLDDPNFMTKTKGLIASIDKVYGIDTKEIINHYYQENDDYFWGATTNHIMPFGFLTGFCEWYMKLTPEIFKYNNFPHFHERAIKIYSILNGYVNTYQPSYLTHIQRNSHGIEL